VKRKFFLILLAPFFLVWHSPSFGKDLAKIAVWDLAALQVHADYAKQLTSILVSELAKLKKSLLSQR
jgi:hypothetical protein